MLRNFTLLESDWTAYTEIWSVIRRSDLTEHGQKQLLIWYSHWLAMTISRDWLNSDWLVSTTLWNSLISDWPSAALSNRRGSNIRTTELSDVPGSDRTISDPSDTSEFVRSSLTGPDEIAIWLWSDLDASDWPVTALGDSLRSEVSDLGFFGTL